MDLEYVIDIVNGTGQKRVKDGTYNVAATVLGYDNSTVLPTSQTITNDVTTYDFTIAASGSLTIHVTEEGTSSGTAVSGATFYRTDSSGNTYGSIVTTDNTGNAVLENVPYSTDGMPPVIYLKQVGTDDIHMFSPEVRSTQLTSQTGTIEIQNELASMKTFNLTDANYDGLVINNGVLTISE